MEDLIEAYLSVYEDSDIKSIAKAAVDHQRHGDYGDADALQKATKAVKKATRYPGRKGPKVTPSLPESYDELNERIDSEGRYIRDSKPNGGSRIITPTSSTSATKPTKPTKATATKPTKTTSYGMEEEFDLYDVVLDHLLDEGYANTEEDALAIMANMSEEWIDSIFEEKDEKEEKGAKWNKGQKLKDPRAQKVFDHMTKKTN